METIEKVNIQTANRNELIGIYNEFIQELQDYVNSKTYNGEQLFTITGELKPLTKEDFKLVGIRMEKRFKRYLKKAYYNRTLASVNSLLHLVHKRILKDNKAPKIVSERHNTIQKLRKEWKHYQTIADNMLAQYKTAKGDFYKDNKLTLK